MKGYILKRIVKSFISIFFVVSIVIAMVYTMIPRNKVLEGDSGYRKLTGDTRTSYMYSKFEELGYLDYLRLNDMCTNESSDMEACTVNGSDENLRVVSVYENDGYTIEYQRNGNAFAYREYNFIELIGHFWKNLFVLDGPNAIQDENNPNLERKIYIGTDFNGVPAIMCSGCEHKYLVYFDSKLPFIHQNWLSLDFGISYPVKAGTPAINVISEGQGSQVVTDLTFPTGSVSQSAFDLHTVRYKYNLDHLDETKFGDDHYADCSSIYESPSMINTSYIFGIVSLIIAYVVGIPAGIAMARNKDKAIDKIGVAFINIIIAMPSLALIFFIRELGSKFGLPDKFPMLGFDDVRSYIAPIIILALLSIPSLMTWTRRYMLDQSNSDYVKFAKAKGLSSREIFTKHILKNAIIPIINGIPGSIILCISGAFITESAFAIPGMGKMLPDSISKMNNNMIIALTFIFSALAIFSVLLGDLLMVAVDPRIQLAAKKGGE